MSEKMPVPNPAKFAIGGLAGMTATLFVQPLDLIKNRMQLSPVKIATITVITNVAKKEGFLAFYNGLSAGLLRQATYTTTRLGIFTWLMEVASKDGPPNFAMKAILGMAAGTVGAFVGTPAEVALIRMTADGRLPPAERRNYKNVFHALYRIVAQEGIFTLWRGAIPTIGRAMVVNAAQLASYTQAKQMFLETGYFVEGIGLHFCASMVSGILTTVTSMPVDIAKTRVQNMKMVNGKPEFTGSVDVLRQIVMKEGPFALWKGFLPYYARLGPHTVLTFVFLEQYTKMYKQLVNGTT